MLYSASWMNLCYVHDSEFFSQRSDNFPSFLWEICSGGVSSIQLREKKLSTADFIKKAHEIKKNIEYIEKKAKNCHHRQTARGRTAMNAGQAQIPMIINDNVEVAIAVKADGVHLGPNDMALGKAKQALMKYHSKCFIGYSLENDEGALELLADASKVSQLSYLSLSPIFSTQSKLDCKRPWYHSGIRKITEGFKRMHSVTLIGIGGIDESNGGSLRQAGLDGLAVISALVKATDPRHVARQLSAQQDSPLDSQENER